MEIPVLHTAVKKEMATLANSYFLAGGCPNVAGIALRMTKLPNGQCKIKKEAVRKLYDFLESLA